MAFRLKIKRTPPAVGSWNEESRRIWVERTLRNLPKGWRILDAGAGEQDYKKYCTHLRYVSQDFAEYNPEGEDSGLQMPKWNYGELDIISDITKIPEADGSFDAVMCLEVLEHVPDPIRVIQELSRLIRLGGRLILSAPFCSLTHFAPFHFSSGFSTFFYEKHLPENGFRILELSSNGNYFEYIAQELRRVESIAERYGGSKLGHFEKGAIDRCLKMLQRFSENDTGSEELLAFGFHVLAEKVS